jgi:hypothetical protein
MNCGTRGKESARQEGGKEGREKERELATTMMDTDEPKVNARAIRGKIPA